MQRFLLLVLFVLNCFLVKAQGFRLKLKVYPAAPSFIGKLKYQQTCPDSLSVISKVNEAILEARKNGFLSASVDSIRWQNKDAEAFLNLKSQYKVQSLSNGNIKPYILQKANFRENVFNNSGYSGQQIEQVIKLLVKAHENSGYPFASVYLDSVSIADTKIKASLYAATGALYVLDTLQIAGDVKVSNKFLQSFLNMKEGSLYSESTIQDIEHRLQELPFLRSIKKPKLTFSGGKAHVLLYLEKQNSNQLDGILGFLPDNTSGKLQVTGDLKLHLQNAFKHAETLGFSFKGLPGKSRELNLAAGLPELFSSPFGIDLSFHLFKQDTNFQNVISKAGITYRTTKGTLLFFLQNRSGSPANSSADSTVLPAFASTRYLSYGAGYSYNSINSRLIPSKGIFFHLDAEAGKKTVSLAKAQAALRDSVNLNFGQYRLSCTFDWYFSVLKRGIVKVSNQTGLLLGKELYENELYRIGGFSSLRGFDEQSILASNYSIVSLEYRLLIEKTSFLFVFANQGIINRRTITQKYNDTPFGLGSGISLQTKAGIFSLSYALGKQRDNPLNLQRGKIHFGLVTLF